MSKTHKVTKDYCGVFQHMARYTCGTCDDETILRRPHMSLPEWRERVDKFLKEHPCEKVEMIK